MDPMLSRIPIFLVAALFLLSLSSCIVHTNDRGRSQHRASKAKKCHPSQYWDGNKCKHKGKGHGARKHDGKRK
jgi:hypothetical protein